MSEAETATRIEAPIQRALDQLFEQISTLTEDGYFREAIARYLISRVCWGCLHTLDVGQHAVVEELETMTDVIREHRTGQENEPGA